MFDLDKWQEIFETIRKNKLRTVLTGFSVGWGIFMLILLLGSTQGLMNGIRREFSDDAINSIWVNQGTTSIAHKGLKPGRRIRFTNEDFDAVMRKIDGVEHITSRFYIPGSVVVNYGDEFGNYNVRCVHPGHKYLENTEIREGRYINEKDIRDFRKVAVLGLKAKDGLFGRRSAIGKSIEVNGISFKVVGIFKDAGSSGEEEVIYLPISTAQRTFNGKNQIDRLMFTIGESNLEESIEIADAVHQLMSERHSFSMEDPKAVRVFNVTERFQEFVDLLDGIRIFVWVIAFGTLLAGIIGVSNIMIIVVKERTKEIGIRKAIGATPRSVISLILQESIFITALSGYIGLMIGVGLLELFNSGLWLDIAQAFGALEGFKLEDIDIFHRPEVDIMTAIQATLMLVVAGAFAALAPALRAARIQPIEALRHE
ncbi:MAG: ABC transporter permease [Bacteroidota bacterium]